MNQKEFEKFISKTKLGRISLRQGRIAYQLVFREEMPENLPYSKALVLAINEAGEKKAANIIRAIDRIDGDSSLMAGWGK